jgi:hypothetical protein
VETRVPMVVDPLEVVVLAFPLVHGIYCQCLTLLWNFSKSCGIFTKGSKQKNIKVYKSLQSSTQVTWEFVRGIYVDEEVHHNDTRCYGSISQLVLVWDFGQGA